jgi:hypothetical protein
MSVVSVVCTDAEVGRRVFISLPRFCTNRATPPRDTVADEGHGAFRRAGSRSQANRWMLSAGEAPAQLPRAIRSAKVTPGWSFVGLPCPRERIYLSIGKRPCVQQARVTGAQRSIPVTRVSDSRPNAVTHLQRVRLSARDDNAIRAARGEFALAWPLHFASPPVAGTTCGDSREAARTTRMRASPP